MFDIRRSPKPKVGDIDMDGWLPEIGVGHGDAYMLLADALEQAVRVGRLKPGDRLPTHRELSKRLGVAVSTVTRAYGEATRRGIIESTVGRGTFVRPPGPGRNLGGEAEERGLQRTYLSLVSRTSAVDLSLNHPLRQGAAQALTTGLRSLSGRSDLDEFALYYPTQGRLDHRVAGSAWLAYLGVEAEPEDVIVVAGGQTALLSIFLAFARRGDVFLAESLTWPGTLAIAQTLGIRLESVAVDSGGILPDAFEEACRRYAPRLLYTMPTLHNPTTATASIERRREVARIARANGVIIVEDDAYGFLVEPRATHYWELARDTSIYLTSMSKPVAPAMRLGYVAAAPALRRYLLSAFRATTVMASPILAELGTRMILDGQAAELARFQAVNAEDRQRLADRILGPGGGISVPASFHRWLLLPAGLRTASFVADALADNVAVTAGDVFAVSSAFDPGGVRICLCSEPDRDRLEGALRVLARLLRQDQSAALPVV